MGLRESQLQGQEHSFNVEAISLVEGIDQNQDLSFWAQGSGIAGPRRKSVEGSEALSFGFKGLGDRVRPGGGGKVRGMVGHPWRPRKHAPMGVVCPISVI